MDELDPPLLGMDGQFYLTVADRLAADMPLLHALWHAEECAEIAAAMADRDEARVQAVLEAARPYREPPCLICKAGLRCRHEWQEWCPELDGDPFDAF